MTYDYQNAVLWQIPYLRVDKGQHQNTLPARLKRSAGCYTGCSQGPWRGCESVLTEIKLKKGESVDKALRRLKKKIDREGTLKVVRNHRHFEKPSEKRRRKEKAARFSAMLSARYADM
jgi:small subunit ribosomal protein S21